MESAAIASLYIGITKQWTAFLGLFRGSFSATSLLT